MKRLMTACMMLMGGLVAILHCRPDSTLAMNRHDLLLWRVVLYGLTCTVGGYLHQHLPRHRPAIRRIAFVFMVLIVLNESVPEISR